ncbi:hypothetical protein IMG5_040880 [Ichthyophthirius multifiliis]|uniref:Uncharacterized protein n=1 Tax=Ichthyophthirius multifiliis TaxID=5932 RepID=G0QM09_ICHMU|nr:hypothetical protein IMG5_040880 [Ichthyophthirius multifiliis]EGR33744.1 hypothetical protein IMG5_040880 [Ichthyophthirius multifiliis]|eukprot:XP_004038968.1 hypothetical protein IMG5_040880 [Ichthyophthirius multifiliis]
MRFFSIFASYILKRHTKQCRTSEIFSSKFQNVRSLQEQSINSVYFLCNSRLSMSFSLRIYPIRYIKITKTQYMSHFMDNYFNQIFKLNIIIFIEIYQYLIYIEINQTMSRPNTLQKLARVCKSLIF